MIRNIKKFEIKHCKYCGAKFPEDSLNNFIDETKNLVCESCGTENKIESFEIHDVKKKERTNVKKGKSDKYRKESSSKKEFNRTIRLYVFRTIYEMLKDNEYNFDIKESVRLIAGTDELEVEEKVKDKIQTFINNIEGDISKAGTASFADVKLRFSSKYKNLPAKFHRYLDEVIKWKLET